jgi:hypothetical protein
MKTTTSLQVLMDTSSGGGYLILIKLKPKKVLSLPLLLPEKSESLKMRMDPIQPTSSI